MIIKTDQNKKTKFTRMCIGEAIIELLKSEDYNRIKISDVVKRAGVARMTFYKYYDSIYSSLTDYLSIIISDYIDESADGKSRGAYMELEHIVYSLEFFDRYSNFFMTLKKSGLYSIMIDGVNRFMEEHIKTERHLSVYELYSYAGGLLNSFLMWEENGKKETALEVGKVICRRFNNDQ